MLLPVKSEARDSMLSGLALQAAITPVYTRHNEIKATPRRSWQEVSRLLGETKALLDASRISDKVKWQTVLANASSFLAMAHDAERQGDNPHFVGWTERAFMMTHHVLDALESLARRTTARDTHWEPGTSDVKRQWFEANTPYGPGDLIKLPNGKIAEVTKCLLGENLFHEPEYHVSTKTGECVVVPVKTRSKDRRAPARLHRALDAVLDSAYAKDKAPFTEDRKLTDLAEKVQRMYLAAPNTYDGIAAVKEKMRKEIAAAGITPGHLAQYITKMSTHLGRRSNVNHIKNL